MRSSPADRARLRFPIRSGPIGVLDRHHQPSYPPIAPTLGGVGEIRVGDARGVLLSREPSRSSCLQEWQPGSCSQRRSCFHYGAFDHDVLTATVNPHRGRRGNGPRARTCRPSGFAPPVCLRRGWGLGSGRTRGHLRAAPPRGGAGHDRRDARVTHVAVDGRSLS